MTGGALVVAAGLVLTGCGSGDGSAQATTAAAAAAKKPDLKVSGAYMPVPPTADMAAGYFTVTNSGGADELTSVSSDIAADVTLHTSEGGAMKEQKSFGVPAGGSLDFARGGNHVMFDKLTHRPKLGEKVSVELHFAKSGTVTVELPVKDATYNPSSHH
ncbi:copper chaperone PCu(A)C [Streptomyces himalayensis]|uniref:Copper chaperone PCu(A)C n=1 Tax=Streptomyces himalayensis subsp. himalayensis TaxID=2756131 RepID=A0A7W0DHX7_9ACTN|nr:copper chaperone PCu(A)C [Streptomyces himalayensis]MBA2945446.1 copper chaperone PCu(A)C [Streptomyces himalayensis subsp. himalayensis]